jgi:hypothetical protein
MAKTIKKNLAPKDATPIKQSFGAAEFKVVCHPDKVQLIIHGNHVVAEAKENVYNQAFQYMVILLGGRIDKKWMAEVDREE